MRVINLDDLKRGMLGVSEAVGKFLVEAAVVSLEENGHQSGVLLKVDGLFSETVQLTWQHSINQQIIQSWKDQNETTEYGATAIAMLLILLFKKMVIVGRAKQTDRIDYLLRHQQNLGTANDHNPEAYLEVSGLWKETKGNTVNIRMRVKEKAVKERNLSLPVYIVVTSFDKPKTKTSLK